MTPPVIVGNEHTPLDFSANPDLQDSFRAAARSFQNAKTLGLHLTANGVCPGNFIGMVWIGEGDSRAVLRADSKFAGMDYIKMFAECAAHPEIGARVVGCLHFWADEELIDAPDDSEFLILTALAYLRELHELCRRRLRRNFVRKTENFCGKVKGKILVAENLRQNIVRARADKIVCEFETIGDDILENRILRAALEKAARLISRDKRAHEFAEPQRWIRACRAALLGAPVSAIRPRDFVAARKRGAFAHYRRPLNLAKAVLLQLGFNPHAEIPEQTKTPPFAMHSEKLFEYYAELKLSAEFAGLRVQKQTSGGAVGDFDVAVRPDFYVPNEDGREPQIIDAKYKPFDAREPDNADFYQVVAYSRHRRLLQKMECGEEAGVFLSLAYPHIGDCDFPEPANTTGAFQSPVRVLKIPCPQKEPRGDS